MAKTASRGRSLSRHVDVLIVGAGLSGLGVASHLTMKQPGRTFAIVDGRSAIGGTWDLFRYPGLRSDSDMHTFGYAFKPWRKKNAIADGHEILAYLHETVEEYHLASKIHLGHKVTGAGFSTVTGRWRVTLERVADGASVEVTCGWLFSAAGYYDYSGGYSPDLPGQGDFTGETVHPQAWPEDLDYTDKKVVVIGSGVTAVTLIPAMAQRAGHITMLQRSPTYVIAVPKQDPVANALKRLLPARTAYRATRAFNINRIRLIYGASRRYPNAVRRIIRGANKRALPKGFDVDTHFNPTYNPWDQRMCTVPDGDLFSCLASGKASVVTDRIVRLTPNGIQLASGDELAADIVVTATGLRMLPYGGIKLSVDEIPVDLHNALAYKAMMISGVPNFAFALGYTNSSWTLKVELVAEHLCRLMARMDRLGQAVAFPVADDDPSKERRPLFDMKAGYLRRAAHLFPQQGPDGPWTMPQVYAVDRGRLRHGPVDDPALRLSTPTAAPSRTEAVPA